MLFTGYLHGDELAQAYASSDLFIFPSATDTLGRVVLEAQASGLPAIVGKLGGAREIVEADASGMVVDMLQPGELQRAMTELFIDREERTRMGIAALEAARRGGSWETMLDELWGGQPDAEDETLASLQRIRREEPALMPELHAH